MSTAAIPKAIVAKNSQFPLAGNDDDDSVVSTNSSISDEEIHNSIEESNVSTRESDSDSSSNQANAEPSCPRPVHHILNALSAVGTFGGLALIITGGMGITLNKPSADPTANGAMLLSGGALLTASFLGGLRHISNQAPAQ
jgi:hypothetical protein